MRPWPSAATRITRSVPRPSILRATNSVAWASSPATTVTGGAPKSPRASTSHPACRSTSWRAAARQVKFAIWQPVTKPTEDSRGRSASSRIQSQSVSSTTPAAGEAMESTAFWSQAEASQSAARDAGRDPPVTKPK